jgi:hypothetical protein
MTEKDNTITKPNKYHNGKIYTIRCRDDDTLIYVGSSCLPLHKRFYQHKQKMKKDKYKKVYFYIKMNELGIYKFYIELYELYKCNTKEELNKREGEVIRQIGTLNMRIAGRTQKEYYENNLDKIKEYYENNKDKIKEYRESNKDKIKEVKKEYYKTNKDKIKEIKKEWYENNKDKIKEYYETNKNKILEKIKCGCGCEVPKCHLNRHMKSQKHMNIMEQFNNTSTNEVVV